MCLYPFDVHVHGDVMSMFLRNVMTAIRKLDLRQVFEKAEIEIVKPMLVDLAHDLNREDPIRFTQIGRKFVVDTTEFRNLLGFHYLQSLVMQPREWVPAKTLSPIGEPVVFEPVAEHGFIRKHLNRKHALVKKLKWMRHAREDEHDPYEEEHDPYNREKEFEIAEELLTIEKYLSSATFGGKIKHVHNNYDRNRQTVTKCIRLAIHYLEDHSDTAHIGQHLRENVKTGALCRYSGKFNWKI